MKHLFLHPNKTNWDSLAYLAAGDQIQRTVRNELRRSYLFRNLRQFKPTLCGTIPLGCNTETSDLDVICQVNDLNSFEEYAIQSLGIFRHLQVKNKTLRGGPAVLARFQYSRMNIEIVAQTRKVTDQYAYAHMIAEAWLLYRHGPNLRAAIKELKRSGLSTEESFARQFSIQGDPYEKLYQLYMDMKNSLNP